MTHGTCLHAVTPPGPANGVSSVYVLPKPRLDPNWTTRQGKFEIRNSKHEAEGMANGGWLMANEIRLLINHQPSTMNHSLAVCFEFRISNFEFSGVGLLHQIREE